MRPPLSSKDYHKAKKLMSDGFIDRVIAQRLGLSESQVNKIRYGKYKILNQYTDKAVKI